MSDLGTKYARNMATTLAPLLTRWCSVPKASLTALEKPDVRDRLLRWLLREIYRDQYLDKMVKRNGLPEG